MAFSVESHMHSSVLQHLPQLLLNRKYAFAEQVPLAYRKVDIGLAQLGKSNLNSQEGRGLAKLSASQIWNLASLLSNELNESVRDKYFSNLLISSDSKSVLVRQLISIGILDQTEQGQIRSSGWLSGHLGPIYMIELKLFRWKEALKQAKFYLSRADFACVVIDGDSFENVDEEEFSNYGIGLFAAWPDILEMKVQPVPSKIARREHKYFNRLRAVQDLCRTKPRKWMIAEAHLQIR